MAFQAMKPEERRRAHERFQETIPEPQVEHRNRGTVASMDEDATLPFRDIIFTVPPVDVPNGLKVTQVLEDWDKLTGLQGKEARDEALRVFKRGIKLIKKLVYPEGMPRFVWVFVRNPFTEASEQEFVTILTFLSMSRMKSSVRRSSNELEK